jgi:hypothetical protein
MPVFSFVYRPSPFTALSENFNVFPPNEMIWQSRHLSTTVAAAWPFQSIGAVARILFRRSGYNLAECFVFALYTGGHLALLDLVFVPLYMLLPPSAAIQGIAGLTVAVIYSVYAARGFFSGGLVVVAIKMGVAYVIAYFIFMVVMMVFVAIYVISVMLPASSGQAWDLVAATDYEAIPVVEKLLDDGADIDMTVRRTALHAAAEHGNLEIVELLISRGADVNAARPAKNHATALMMAAGSGNLDIVGLLLDRGADPSATNHKGETALDLAKGKDVREALRAAAERAPPSPPVGAEP